MNANTKKVFKGKMSRFLGFVLRKWTASASLADAKKSIKERINFMH